MPGKRLIALAREKLDRFGDREADLPLGFLKKEMDDVLALEAQELLRIDLRDRLRI